MREHHWVGVTFGLPCVVRGLTHHIARPWPWYTTYSTEELPPVVRWVAIDGGAAVGIGSAARLAY